jgi:hypothetical protein
LGEQLIHYGFRLYLMSHGRLNGPELSCVAVQAVTRSLTASVTDPIQIP